MYLQSRCIARTNKQKPVQHAMEVRGRRREAVQTQYQMHMNDRFHVPFTFASTSTQNGTDIES